jgi:multidrug resistance protein
MATKKVLPLLFATLLLDSVGFGIVTPIFPVLFTDPASPSFLLHGYSVSGQYLVAGAVTAVFALMQFLAAPILGELSDVYGRKKLLTLGVAVLALSQLLFGLGVETGLLALLFVSRVVAGLASANFSIAQATIADVTEPKDRAKNFGMVGAAFGVGFILGPLLGGWITGFTANPAVPFWVAGALGILNVVFVTLVLPETRKPTGEAHVFNWLKGIRNVRAAMRDVDARPVYLANFLYMSGFSFFISFIAIMLLSKLGFAETDIGLYFALVGACIIVTQMFILRIVAGKYPERTILRSSMWIVGAAIAAYAFVPNAALAFVLVPIMAVPQGLTMANLTALVSKSVSADRQGAAMGINASVMALAGAIVPLIAGAATGVLGLKLPFLAGGALILCAWAVITRKRSVSA